MAMGSTRQATQAGSRWRERACVYATRHMAWLSLSRLAAGVVSLLVLARAPKACAAWQVDLVEVSYPDWSGTSVRADAAGRLYAAAGGESLRLAIWDGTTWSSRDIDATSCGKLFPSL